MRLSRLFINTTINIGQHLTLPPEKGHYVKNVLRLKDLHNIYLFNGQNDNDYLCSIKLQGKQVSVSPEKIIPKTNDSNLRISLVQALGKPEHIDFIIQKATELGVNKITFFNAERTQTPLKNNRLEKKLLHWNNIASSACEQCNRNRIPSIKFTNTLHEALESPSNNQRILLDQDGLGFNTIKSQLNTTQDFEILIGCEGGLTLKESNWSQSQGFQSCSLGPRILRMETASTAIITLIQQAYGDLN